MQEEDHFLPCHYPGKINHCDSEMMIEKIRANPMNLLINQIFLTYVYYNFFP